MRKLPKGSVPFLLLLAFLLFGYALWQIKNNDMPNPRAQYLDQVDLETGNPQPAGNNIAP